MKKVLTKIFILLTIVISFFLNVGNVSAAGEHIFSLSAYDWDPINETGTGDPINNGDDVEPGQVIQIAVHVQIGTPTVLSMQLGLNYDNAMVEPLLDEEGNLIYDMGGTTYDPGGIYPSKGTTGTARYQTNWVILTNLFEDRQLLMIVKDTTRAKQLATSGVMMYLYFKVKDTAPAGGQIHFTWDDAYNTMEQGPKPIATGISFDIFGTMSNDNTLNTLTVKNGGTTYPLSPAFVVGSTTPNSFTTVVPNGITSIDIAATAHDSVYGAVLPGGLGTKALTVGDNTFQIVGQAQNGTTQIYTIVVKRLSNNADLGTLSLSGVTLSPGFSGADINYTSTVPYATSSTNVSATVADTGKATILSGTGTWNLTTTGATVNNKDIIVNAENCKVEYSGVAGNTCTSKTYNVKITRIDPSTNANLSSLTVDGVSVPSFSGNTITYTLANQANSKTSVNIAAIVADTGKATITSGTGVKTLNVGDNAFPVLVTAEDGITTKTYTINIRRLSNNGNLSNLTITSTPSGTLNPTFSPTFYNYYTYSIDATVASINIVGTLQDSTASLTSGFGTHPITGDTTINLVVTAEDGTIITYIVKVNKSQSSNNNLSSLSIDGVAINPTFDKTVTLYTATVPSGTAQINVNAIVEDTGKATIISGTGIMNLNYGANTIQVRVEAENGITKDYTITVTREKSSNADLSDIKIDGVSIPGFHPNTIVYNLADVPYSTTNISLTASLADSNSVMTGTGTKTLITGPNSFDLVVTAQDGTTVKTYTINVTRDKNNVATLSSLTIPGFSINPPFSSTTDVYNITVPNSKTIFNPSDINVIPTDSKATYVKDDPLSLVTTAVNTYNIVVTAEDGVTTKTYKVNITRLKSDNGNLATLTVTNGSFNPSFTSGTYSYTVTIPTSATNFDVDATLVDNTATITSGLGNYQITGATTYVTVVVTTEDGIIVTYDLTVNRALSGNNNLSSLTLTPGGLNEVFEPGTTLYTANVLGDVTSINLAAIVEDTGRATVISGTGSHTLVVGANTIQVRVKAENGVTKDYTITVNRAAKTIAGLSALTVDGVPVADFDTDVLNYTLSNTLYTKTSINIGATKIDTDSTISGLGNKPLLTGNNSFQVIVTAQDGVSQKIYTINVYRAKSTNANLSDLKINNLTIAGFDKTIKEYNLTVANNVTSLNLNAIPEDTAASILINNNSNFKTTEVNVVTIIVQAEDGNIEIYTINVTREKSTNNYLSNIAVSSGLLNPVFTKTNEDYTVTVPRSLNTITLTPTVEDSTATYVVHGPATLDVGDNVYTISVTSESGADKYYTVTVSKVASNNNYLTDLTIDGTTITGFSKTNNLYTINVPSTTINISVNGTKEDSTATVNGFQTYTLVTGANTIPVTVTAEDGDIRTYSIVINRALSNNNDLNSLSILQTTLNEIFNPSTLTYTAAVGYGVTSIDIQALVADTGKATVTGTGNKVLNTGANTFNIVVTAEDNTTKTYTLTVTRAKNSNANLTNIILSGGYDLVPDFDKNTTTYSVLVPNSAANLNITAYKEDPNALVTGAGLKNLSTGLNTITITVTAENGTTTKNYILNITREKSTVNDLLSLTTPNGTIAPLFEKDTTEYQLSVPNEVENLILNAVKVDPASVVTIIGDTGLVIGVNYVTVVVTAEDGSIKLYNIEVTREPSGNNFLSDLKIKNMALQEYTIAFSKIVLNYSIIVSNNIDSVIIEAFLDDPNAILVSGTGTKSLSIGNNNFDVVVKSANNISRTYTINIVREASGNADLSNLVVTGFALSPIFDRDTTLYTVDVPSGTTSVEITGLTDAANSTVAGFGTFNIVTGINPFTVLVTAENGTVTKTYNIVVNKAASSNNFLGSLSVTPGSFSPVFNKNNNLYTMTVEFDTNLINITAVPEDNFATVAGDGNKSLPVGTTTFEVIVTAENNLSNIYKLEATRKASSNNNLMDLSVDGVTVTGFDKDTLRYTMNVENSKTRVDIGAITEDVTATVVGIGQVQLNTNANVIPITVTAQNGDIKIYELVITRAKSSNNYLASISALEGAITPDFDKNTSNYSINVPNEITSLTLSTTKEVNTSVVEIDGNSGFNVGANTVYINVIAENGDIRIYTLTVNRYPYANNFLSSLTVVGTKKGNYDLAPVFNKTNLGYTITVSAEETEITIDAVKESISSSVLGTGSFTITSNPQIFEVICSSSTGVERIYTITVKRAKSDDNYLKSLTVSEGVLDPSFDKNTTAYTVDVDTDVNTIDISAIANDSNAIVIGTGTKALVSGKNTFNIVVTADNGNIRSYTIFVMKAKANDVYLSNLTVSEGALDPLFNPNTTFYMVHVDLEVDTIDISATTTSPGATITGTGTKSLAEGTNVFTVKVTGTSNKDYTIIVTRGDFVEAYLQSLSITGYTMNETFNRTRTNYTLTLNAPLTTNLDINAVPLDPLWDVQITGNVVMTSGTHTIKIKVTTDKSVEKEYIIVVTVAGSLDKITSVINTVGVTYVKGLLPLKTSSEVKAEMTNPASQLKIYLADGTTEVTNEYIATGMIMKLIIGGNVVDSKILVIKGDVNGDGDVSVPDVVRICAHLSNPVLTGAYYEAADVSGDDDVTISDVVRLVAYLVGTTNIYDR